METIRAHRHERLRAKAWLLVPAVWASTLSVAGTPADAALPNAGGTQVWAARDAGPHGAYDDIGGMAMSPDGSTIYVVRSSDGAFVVVAHDALTGASEWVVHTEDRRGGQIFAHAVGISPDGMRLFVTGEVERSVDSRKTLTVAYDTSDGSVLWSALLSAGTEVAIPRRIAVSPDGAHVFVTGSRTGRDGPDDFWDYFTAAYSAYRGSSSWMSNFDGRAHRGDTAEGIGVSPDGTRVFVTGTSKSSRLDERDFVTIAYAATDGSRLWTSRYTAGADNFATDLAVSPDGSQVYVAGFGRHTISLPHVYTLVAYDATSGRRTGVGRYAGAGDAMCSSLALSGDGAQVFVTGSASGDYLTVAFDTSTYQAALSSVYDGGHGIDVAYAIAVSPAGTRVYVAGESQRRGNVCFGDVGSTALVTVSYDATTGDRRWASRFAGRNNDPDQPRQVAVSPDGSLVIVTGNTDSACTGSDVTTVAYRP